MPTCFVVMGFGVKTDYQSGRKLDLDKSYQNLIKPAVESAGLSCIRADEIVHAGLIDQPMYEMLLMADVVVADLSTMNANAFYELGVRHALRPYTTIVIAESELKFPFDVNHIAIRTYRHLGEDIGFSEAQRFQKELSSAIREIMQTPKDDSPVYRFLELMPPTKKQLQAVVKAMEQAAESSSTPTENLSLRVLLDKAAAARVKGRWSVAKELFEEIRDEMKAKAGGAGVDPYIIQQLALATYKADGSEEGLRLACKTLWDLHPDKSNDPETLGLWGAIHKRLWEVAGDREALDQAVTAYERGFYIRNDYYNGINFAFLLNMRAASSTGDDAIADRVVAARIRKQVIPVCKKLLGETDLTDAERYWAMASLAEAYFGLGDKTMCESTMEQARGVAPEPWMIATTKEQLDKLDRLLSTT